MPSASLAFSMQGSVNPLSAKVANLQRATLLNKTVCTYKCGAEYCSYFSPGDGDVCGCNLSSICVRVSIQSFTVKNV